jgi:hypothetical protein
LAKREGETHLAGQSPGRMALPFADFASTLNFCPMRRKRST